MPAPGALRRHYHDDAGAARPSTPNARPEDWDVSELGMASIHPPPNTAAPSLDCIPSPPRSAACPSPSRGAGASPPPRPVSSSFVSARPCRAEKRPIDPSFCLSLLARVAGFLMSSPDGFNLSPDKNGGNLTIHLLQSV